jgi:hypothetical protein
MKLQLKRSNVLVSGAAKEPEVAQLDYGELAVNYNTADPKLFIKDSANTIVSITGNSLPLTGGTVTGDVTVTGDLTVGTDGTFTGDVVAASFTGDGANLTNLPITVPTLQSVTTVGSTTTTGATFGGNVTFGQAYGSGNGVQSFANGAQVIRQDTAATEALTIYSGGSNSADKKFVVTSDGGVTATNYDVNTLPTLP